MPSLAAAAAARRAGEALRRGVAGGFRSLSSLRPSPATSAAPDSEEVTARQWAARVRCVPTSETGAEIFLL